MITFWYLITYFVQTTFVFVWYTILLSYCICCANYLKISYSKFLFFHHEFKVGIWFYIVKTAVQAEMCVASCLKCGAFCSTIQVNLHPDHFPSHVYPLHQIYSQSKKCETFQLIHVWNSLFLWNKLVSLQEGHAFRLKALFRLDPLIESPMLQLITWQDDTLYSGYTCLLFVTKVNELFDWYWGRHWEEVHCDKYQ